jgi:hypothetical protein
MNPGRGALRALQPVKNGASAIPSDRPAVVTVSEVPFTLSVARAKHRRVLSLLTR